MPSGTQPSEDVASPVRPVTENSSGDQLMQVLQLLATAVSAHDEQHAHQAAAEQAERERLDAFTTSRDPTPEGRPEVKFNNFVHRDLFACSCMAKLFSKHPLKTYV